MKPRVLSIQEFSGLIKTRQGNKYDCNMAVSGARGNGKSTFLFKLFMRFEQFRPKSNIVYKRKEVMTLLEQKGNIIMDDEAIRTGYKRNFYDQDQKLLIQMLNMYRDNLNLYGMAIPNFYSLDKGIRDLIKFHVNIIDRGLGVIHISRNSLYSDDMWDVNYNKKKEERWSEKIKKHSTFRPPHHKLSTFFAYIKFGDITIKQRELYEDIKSRKRKEVYDEEMALEQKPEQNIHKSLLMRMKAGKISESMFLEFCVINNLKHRLVRSKLNELLKDDGDGLRVKNLLIGDSKLLPSSAKVDILTNNVKLPVI